MSAIVVKLPAAPTAPAGADVAWLAKVEAANAQRRAEAAAAATATKPAAT